MTDYEIEDTMPQAAPSKEEILTAFAADPEYAVGTVNYEVLKDYIVLLPEVIGEERLNERLDLAMLFQIGEDFLQKILSELPADGSKEIEELRDRCRDFLGKIRGSSSDVPGLLAKLGTTEGELFLSEDTGLDEKLRLDYEYGMVSFGDIVRTQPSFYAP